MFFVTGPHHRELRPGSARMAAQVGAGESDRDSQHSRAKHRSDSAPVLPPRRRHHAAASSKTNTATHFVFRSFYFFSFGFN